MLSFAYLVIVFLFFSASLDLRCTAQDEVIKAIEKTKKYYPQSNFNSLTNQEGTILPIEKPTSCATVSYSDTEVKQNDASLDCLLRNATEVITSNIYFNPLEKICNNRLDIGYACI